MKFSGQKSVQGFTLIELLVVIAIIGVLSSVILASLNTARNKAKDAAVKSGVQEMVKLMAFEYDDKLSYDNLQLGWMHSDTQCSSNGDWGNPFRGNYAANAVQICKSISTANGNTGVHFGNSVDNAGKFSVMAWLPGKGTYYCAGSSGATSDVETGSNWLSPGCYANP